jgi:hypothetical protein
LYDVEHSPILSDKIKEGASELQKSSKLRSLFVTFVFDRRWMRDILHHRTISFFPHILENGFSSRIFYHMPNGGYFYVPKADKQEHSSRPSTHSESKDGDTSASIDPSSFCPANAGLFVLAILLPLFMKTAHYRTHFDEDSLPSSQYPQGSNSPSSTFHRMRTMVSQTAHALSTPLAETSLHLVSKHSRNVSAQNEDDEEEDEEESTTELIYPNKSDPVQSTSSGPAAQRLNVPAALTIPPPFSSSSMTPSPYAAAEDGKAELLNKARANWQENRSVLEEFFRQSIDCLQRQYSFQASPAVAAPCPIAAQEATTEKGQETKSNECSVFSPLEDVLASGDWLAQVLRFLDELKYSISLAWSSDSHYFTSTAHSARSLQFHQPTSPKRTISKNFRQDPASLPCSSSYTSTAASSPKHTSSTYPTHPSSPLAASPAPKMHFPAPSAFASSFPLCYVNQSFEALTQWTGAELYGQSARCLHSEEVTEMQQVERLKEALNDLQPTKLAITNIRRDGSSFVNLLALKPVVLCAADLPQFHLHKQNHLKPQSPRKNRNDVVGTAVIGLQYDFHRMKHRSPQQQQQSNSMAVDLEAIDLLLHLLPLLIT